jgi:fructose-1,6-bisphosphatase/inositol monophosphatase family enzyme
MSDLDELATALAAVGRAVRDAVLAVDRSPDDARVVRTEGGDDVFGVDARADAVVLRELRSVAARWPGRLVMEGFAEPIALGDDRGDGPWTYLVDPFDGTRPWLAGKRSAWVLLGAGRDARTLEDLEVGAAVELPTARARWARAAWATNEGRPPTVEDDDLADPSAPPRAAALTPRQTDDLARAYVTVARFDPGSKARIGAWEDEVLAGCETYEDPYLCSGGQMMGVAAGEDAAVLDPRPLLGARFCAHPYDLAALVVARAAGAVVEALPPGPLGVALDPHVDVAWATYANEAVAEELRSRVSRATRPRPATPGRGRGGSG